ncbi:MAG: GIY-YIG nuclease family protein [Candidatus Moranbacteria bacterium]|nr:GIY-YIG nuclease family protein [Candidatus Moranbacteria bacterium]
MQMSSKLAQKLKKLPTSPGVYIFRNNAGVILYVGKATSLKDRVSSYFQFNTNTRIDANDANMRMGERPIEMFIDQVVDIEVRKTETVLEAYILEQDLIKKWQPKFNVDGKDDKSFCYVVITKELFPRIVILRKTELLKVPISNFQFLNKTQFPIPKFSNELNPPAGGENLKLKIEPDRVFGPYISKKNIEIALKILRKISPYHSKAQKTEKGCLDFQIGLCPGPYAGAISKEDYAKNIRGIKMILEGKKKTLLAKMKKEMSAYSEKQEFERAGKVRNAIFALQHIADIALVSYSMKHETYNKNANSKIFRVEGYDISNISGRSSVGSMVVFDNSQGELTENKSQYRKFKIKTIEGANDTASMAEVLGRRFGNSWPKPDLIILDGGQGHLTAVRRVLKNFHLEIPLLAVAKGPARKKLDRYAFGSVPEISDEIIERVRDEAHRFAITYHKKLRGKDFMK